MNHEKQWSWTLSRTLSTISISNLRTTNKFSSKLLLFSSTILFYLFFFFFSCLYSNGLDPYKSKWNWNKQTLSDASIFVAKSNYIHQSLHLRPTKESRDCLTSSRSDDVRVLRVDRGIWETVERIGRISLFLSLSLFLATNTAIADTINQSDDGCVSQDKMFSRLSNILFCF